MFLTLFRPLYLVLFDPLWYHGIMAGTILGYLCYDMIHYMNHHYDFDCSHLKTMKKYHLIHHYRNGELGFGVSIMFWDRVFGTLLPGF